MQIPITRLPHYPAETELPRYATAGASGIDLCAAISAPITIREKPVLIPCGFRIAIPEGYEAQVRSRSGLALKQGLFVLNGIGTIDSDYRGEIKVLLAKIDFVTVYDHLQLDNTHVERLTLNGRSVIQPGDRIAQLVFAPVTRVAWAPTPAEAFAQLTTLRGEGGFGSTGT